MLVKRTIFFFGSLLTTFALNDTKKPKKGGGVPSLITPDQNYTFLSIFDDTYGARNVSYFESSGLAIIDGDIVYGSVKQLLANTFNPDDVKRRRASSVFAGGGQTWPNANITYRYDSDATEATLSAIVNDAINRWLKKAPYLTFFQLDNIAKPENGVLLITANDCGGCQASVGWANTPRFMNLQQDCKKTGLHCSAGDTTHELGHVLGLWHEHQKPNREDFVHYECANLDPNCPTGTSMGPSQNCCDDNVPTGCCSVRGNFDIHASGSVDASAPYDPRSIMHYTRGAFAIGGLDTLISTASFITVPTVKATTPSQRDYDRICKIYRVNCPLAKVCGKTNCPAKCVRINQCRKPGLCDDLISRPPCCDADTANEECERKKKECEDKGCDIFNNN